MPRQLIPITLVLLSTLAAGFQAHAEDGWKNETEISVVQTRGNTATDSYSARQRTSYLEGMNTYILSGRYLETRTSGIESAKAWDAGFRYERAITDLWSSFAGISSEADTYAGFKQRNFFDLGGKYSIIKSEERNLSAEAGYRRGATYFTNNTDATDNYARFFLDYSQKLNEAVSFRIWAEYLPNFTRSEAYLANGEPSVSVMLSKVFFLKMAYLMKYRNEIIPAAPTNSAASERLDTTFTTSIAARF